MSSAWRFRLLILCIALAAGTLLDRAAFGAGLSGDDYVQQATLTHRLPISRSPLGAYNAVENP
ncbi:MAG: hypothetical protein KC776_33160, partial [Myxococcales bacterium]|nr:hypothetical protein [Myxococcales bacterium]